MAATENLVIAVIDELGLDVYHLYPDTRRRVPETVLWGMASACILELIKGFFDLKAIGEEARRRADELLRRWKERDGFEGYIQTLDLRMDLTQFLDTVQTDDAEAKMPAGIERLTNALEQLGATHADASEHAREIAKLVTEYLKRPS